MKRNGQKGYGGIWGPSPACRWTSAYLNSKSRGCEVKLWRGWELGREGEKGLVKGRPGRPSLPHRPGEQHPVPRMPSRAEGPRIKGHHKAVTPAPSQAQPQYQLRVPAVTSGLSAHTRTG